MQGAGNWGALLGMKILAAKVGGGSKGPPGLRVGYVCWVCGAYVCVSLCVNV